MPGLLDPDFWQYSGATSGLLGPPPEQSSGLLTPPPNSDGYRALPTAQTGLLHLAAGPKPPKNWIPPTNPPQLPPDPETLPPGHNVRIGPPSELYPDGYFRIYNADKQPVDPSTMKPGNQGQTHVPLPPIPTPLFRPPILPPVPFMVLTPEMRRMIFPDNEA